MTPVEVRELKLELDTSASSKDLQTVQSRIVVNFHPVVDKVDELYNNVGRWPKPRPSPFASSRSGSQSARNAVGND